MLIYTVKSGDTLAGIASRFGVPANRIAADNSLTNMRNLVPGQSLLIMTNAVRYILREGQTLYSLSQEYGVPLEELVRANPDLNPIALRAGDTIIIPIAEEINRRPIVVNGFAYPNINANALNCVLPFLTFMSPFSYTITSQGELLPPDASDLIYRSARSAVMPLMVVTNIFDGTFSTETLSQILADESARVRLLDSILFEMESKGYYGLNMDMEYIAPEDRESYNDFLRTLADRLHERGYILAVSLAPKTYADQQGLLYESHDYRAQGEIADYAIIMTYEWGYLYGPPLAVSPINEVRRVLEYAVTEMPSEKILVGMPNYGYDWTLPYMRGTPARSVGFIEATDLALRFGSEIRFDEASQTPYFNYTENGVRHVVWFDDPRSIQTKLGLINEFNLAGVSYWTVNRCYVPNWLILQGMYEIMKL